MKIVFQHDHPLPVIGYGGTERILFWHMKELARIGHEVVLIGHPNSKIEQYGIKLIPQIAPWEKQVPKDADIIHLQYNYTAKVSIPTINTVHGNGKMGEKFTHNSVFVSKSHAENHGSDYYIHNALDFSEYPTSKKRSPEWENFLFLAKASWKVKNLKDTVFACKQAEKFLHVAGGRYWWLSRYVKSYGQVDGEMKNQLLSISDALIFPVRWHEPFGIAVLESMAMGKPVLASKYGGPSEIIEEGTGYLCKNLDELIDLLKNKRSFKTPDEIRAYVNFKFNINTYTSAYLNLYKKVIENNKLQDHLPSWKFDYQAETLLPF